MTCLITSGLSSKNTIYLVNWIICVPPNRLFISSFLCYFSRCDLSFWTHLACPICTVTSAIYSPIYHLGYFLTSQLLEREDTIPQDKCQTKYITAFMTTNLSLLPRGFSSKEGDIPWVTLSSHHYSPQFLLYDSTTAPNH